MIARLCSWLMVGPAGLKLGYHFNNLCGLTGYFAQRFSAASRACLANLFAQPAERIAAVTIAGACDTREEVAA